MSNKKPSVMVVTAMMLLQIGLLLAAGVYVLQGDFGFKQSRVVYFVLCIALARGLWWEYKAIQEF